MACQLDGFMPPPTRGRGGFFPDPLWANPAQQAQRPAMSQQSQLPIITAETATTSHIARRGGPSRWALLNGGNPPGRRRNGASVGAREAGSALRLAAGGPAAAAQRNSGFGEDAVDET